MLFFKLFKHNPANLLFAVFVIYSPVATASFSGQNTLKRMATYVGWDNLWILVLVSLFIFYPLLMGAVLFVVGKTTGLEGLLNTNNILEAYGIALMGLFVAFGIFLFLLFGIFFLDISPAYFYAAFLLFMGALSYRLVMDAISRERRKNQPRN